MWLLGFELRTYGRAVSAFFLEVNFKFYLQKIIKVIYLKVEASIINFLS